MQKEQADFKIDYCTASYKGKELPLGKPLEEWVKIFGKYDRNLNNYTYVWDSLGISIFNSQLLPEETAIFDELYIFFTNLDSPTGQDGKLQYAERYSKFTEEKGKKMLTNEARPFTQEEVGEIKEKYNPKNYIYPYTIYLKIVDIHGAMVQTGMKLKEVNKARSKVKGLEKFGYWDKDGNWSNDSGSTSIKNGEFREDKHNLCLSCLIGIPSSFGILMKNWNTLR